MPRRVCFALDLVDDAALIADYDGAHAPGAVWPDVTAGIKAKGFLDMEIWRVRDRLFMIATVTDDWPRQIDAKAQEVDARWESAMDGYQKPLACAGDGEKWVPMTRIYALHQQ